MTPPRPPDGTASDHASGAGSAPKIKADELLKDFREGLRTKGFLAKYGLSIGQFEQLLKQLIRDGLFTREEYHAWKSHREAGADPTLRSPGGLGDAVGEDVELATDDLETYVITHPEMNNSWALQLFSTISEDMEGAKFKAVLQGKKYSFVVKRILYRGSVTMLGEDSPPKAEPDRQSKREEAIEFIAKHGWSAYLENRAFQANFGEHAALAHKKAKLALIRCRNDTYLAALHTPAPAINIYVGPSLENIRKRLSSCIDMARVKF
jgi:hypothetical protein